MYKLYKSDSKKGSLDRKKLNLRFKGSLSTPSRLPRTIPPSLPSSLPPPLEVGDRLGPKPAVVSSTIMQYYCLQQASSPPVPLLPRPHTLLDPNLMFQLQIFPLLRVLFKFKQQQQYQTTASNLTLQPLWYSIL